MEKVELAPLLESIRDELELIDRNRQAHNRPALFELQSFELELKFVVTKQENASGGFNFQVVRLEGSDTLNSEAVQTIRLSYKVTKTRPAGSRLHSTSDEGTLPEGIELLRATPDEG